MGLYLCTYHRRIDTADGLVPRLHCPAFFVLWKNTACVFPKCEKRWAVEPANEATQLIHLFYALLLGSCYEATQLIHLFYALLLGSCYEATQLIHLFYALLLGSCYEATQLIHLFYALLLGSCYEATQLIHLFYALLLGSCYEATQLIHLFYALLLGSCYEATHLFYALLLGSCYAHGLHKQSALPTSITSANYFASFTVSTPSFFLHVVTIHAKKKKLGVETGDEAIILKSHGVTVLSNCKECAALIKEYLISFMVVDKKKFCGVYNFLIW